MLEPHMHMRLWTDRQTHRQAEGLVDPNTSYLMCGYNLLARLVFFYLSLSPNRAQLRIRFSKGFCLKATKLNHLSILLINEHRLYV